MRRCIILVSFFPAVLFGCKKSTDISCGETTPSFSTTVNSVVQKNCTSCHGSKNPAGGISLADYSSIYKNRVEVRSVVAGGNHENVSMSSNDVNTVCCWIDAGAPNN